MAYGDRSPFITSKGYVRLYEPEHPLANRWGHVMEHRKVAWDHGIIVRRRQVVHHLNHDRVDNRPENLAAMATRAHNALHARQRIPRTRVEYLQSERARYRRRRAIRTCEVCTRDYGWNGTADPRGCSNACRAVLRKRDGERPSYMRDCEVCAREFRCRVGDGRACSPTCRASLRASEAA